MNKKKLCEAVRSIKNDYNLRYSDMCKPDNAESPVNTTQLGYILHKDGCGVSVEKIINLLEFYGLTVETKFSINSYKGD